MKIGQEQKKEMLLSTFEVLKLNYNDNKFALCDLVEKMSKIDLDLAVEMWKYLISNNKHDLYANSSLAFLFMYGIEKSVGKEKAYSLVAADDFLKNSIYKECGNVSLSPLQAIQYFITINDLNTANELMNLVFLNKHKNNSLYNILDEVIPPDDAEISEEAFELLAEWINKVTDKEEKAKLNLKMLNFVDEE